MKNYISKTRGAGVLLHISSLPSKYGIGSMGKQAFEFVDFLEACGQKYWQILPFTPTGHTNSPYQSYSAFGYNPLFIDIEELYEQGLLTQSDLEKAILPHSPYINYSRVRARMKKLLPKAFSNFDTSKAEFLEFLTDEKHFQYAHYMVLKKYHGKKPWYEWDEPFKYYNLTKDNPNKDLLRIYDGREGMSYEAAIRAQNPNLVKSVLAELRYEVYFHLFTQYEFSRQWKKLKAYANSKGISIIGDMPIYLDYDSDECWVNPRLLDLDDSLNPRAVAGVPPDYFSTDGQLWGNPVYDWDYHKKNQFTWWKERITQMSQMCDLVRIDHFRGFYEFYSIPPHATTAREGEWRKGGGVELFNSLDLRLKNAIIAEDLGLLDKGAMDFFAELNFPGMKVLQFAFDGNDDNPHLPKNHTPNSVVYTGTHDNNTLIGWLTSFRAISEKQRIMRLINESAASQGIDWKAKNRSEACQLLIEIALSSQSDICIIPIQDYLGLDVRYRMNIPGTVDRKNWIYKLEAIPTDLAKQLKMSAKKYKRL